jgi:pimeloyl-ACP methyl ester carboxylesterase
MTQTFQNATTRTIKVKGTQFVYRELGERRGVPVIFLHHLTAVLDDCDPKLLDGIAGSHHVVIFDNRGVGGSGGQAPVDVADMAEDAIAFIAALGFAQVDLFGFSLGGFIAQVIAQPSRARPQDGARWNRACRWRGHQRYRRGPSGRLSESQGGEQASQAFLFFSPSHQGQKAADSFLQRLGARQADRNTPISDHAVLAQVTAILKWGQAPGSTDALKQARNPVLIANGDADVVVSTANSVALFEALPNAKLSIIPDAGHGGIFQHADAFVDQTLCFLAE